MKALAMFQGDIEHLLAVDHGSIDLVHNHPNLLALVVKTAQAVANATRMLARRATTRKNFLPSNGRSSSSEKKV